MMSATFNLDGGEVPWTTTPELRLGPGPPFIDPSLQANLFFRITLGIISIFISLVPARLLWWNGEFAATIFCINTIISNFFYVVNALIWHDNNVQTWWAGYGWCDLQVYIVFALQTSYNICLFENMRGLASKVSIQRLGALTAAEKRRQHMISAVIIFSLPLLQVVLTYFIIMRRYNVSTLAGCTAVYDPNWVFLLFFVLPSPLFILGAGVMALLAFKRVREIQKMTSSLMHFRDDAQLARQSRVRRKLYFLSFSVLLVVIPIVSFFFVANILEGMPWTKPYDYKRIHFGPFPNNIYTITFTTSDKMGFGDLTFNYIAIISAIAVFITFGTTPDAYNEYRKALLFFGLGKIFPKLYEEYKPTPPTTPKSWWSSFTETFMSRDRSREKGGSRKGSLAPTAEHISVSDSQPGPSSQSNNSATDQNPWPDLSLEEIAQHQNQKTRFPQRHIFRNPFKPFEVPLPSGPHSSTSSPATFSPFSFFNKNKKNLQIRTQGKQPDTTTTNQQIPSPNSVLSEVIYPTTIETLAAIHQKEEMKRYRPLQRFTAGTTGVSDHLPRYVPQARVDTRVWADVDSTFYSSSKISSSRNTSTCNSSKDSCSRTSSSEYPWSSTISVSKKSNSQEGQNTPPTTTRDCPVCSRLRQALGHHSSSHDTQRGVSSSSFASSSEGDNGHGQQPRLQPQPQRGVMVETSIAHHSMRGDDDYGPLDV